MVAEFESNALLQPAITLEKGYTYIINRQVQCVTGGIKFGDSILKATTASDLNSGVYNHNAIPLKIYGLKKVSGGGRYLIDYLRLLCGLIGGAWHEWNRSCEQRTPSLIWRSGGAYRGYMELRQTPEWPSSLLGDCDSYFNMQHVGPRRIFSSPRRVHQFPGWSICRNANRGGRSIRKLFRTVSTISPAVKRSILLERGISNEQSRHLYCASAGNRSLEITLERGCAA